jgi:FKBP-type peptidyl-prolyl cis-trans isomerase FklB
MTRHLAVACVAVLLWVGPALALDLGDDNKRLSYIIGMQIGQQLKSDGIELDEAAFMAAIKDAAAGNEPQLSQQEMQATMQRMQAARAAKVQALGERNRVEGEKFLAANKGKEGVTELPSGLQYKVIKAGSGASPKATDTVEVHYRGTLLDGTEFDSSYSRGAPATFPVNGVIKGWQEALQAMNEGAKWQIFVPAKLAYGSRGAGSKIGPNATLIFDVELLKIKH